MANFSSKKDSPVFLSRNFFLAVMLSIPTISDIFSRQTTRDNYDVSNFEVPYCRKLNEAEFKLQVSLATWYREYF